jgi:putative colanic acid biosynthesis acetyltransferase WcaF
MQKVAERRSSRKWSRKEIVGRVLWSCVSPFFRWSPRLLWGWRRCLLRCFGAQIGKGVNIYPSCRITIPWNLEIGDWSTIGDGVKLYALGPIKIGAEVTVSQGAHVCAGSHDYEDPKFLLLKLPITIQNSVWVCADAFVGPNIRIGKGAVIAARSVVVKDVQQWEVVGGNPAKRIKNRDKRNFE